MDEATANIDFKTEGNIENTLREHLKESTVLKISHRLKTILDYDKIIVMDKGKMIEYDTPNALRQRDTSFAELCRKAGY